MRDFLILAALSGFSSLVSAQDIPISSIDSLPKPTYTIVPDKTSQAVGYNQDATIESDVHRATETPVDTVIPEQSPTPEPTAGSNKRTVFPRRSLEKRNNDCQPVPTTPNRYNAVIDPAESFLADQNLQNVALSAATPSGYTQTFSNLKAASQANGYMGYYLLDSYDTGACAAKCNNALGCQAFNIYFERSPSIVPASSCPNPPGTANIFCVLWGGPISRDNARNDGQWRDQYHVVISASNGYVLTSSLSPLSGKAINAPLDCNNDDAYMGIRMFTDNAPFDPERCRAVCEATSQYNIEHNPDPSQPPRLCKFFNTYILSKNYRSLGQSCAMYTQYWDPDTYATNDGQWDGEGNHYTISSSVFFHNATDVVTPVCPADITRLQGDNDVGAFCTAYIDYTPATTSTVTVYTSTTTVQACGSAPTNRIKRDGDEEGLVEAVVAVFPEKVDGVAAGDEPALVTIPAESLTVSGVYASATSAGEAQLAHATESSDLPTATGASGEEQSGLATESSNLPTVTPTPTPSAAAAKRAAPAETPSFFVGRDSRVISSACSHIATGIATVTRSAVATATNFNVANCAQYPTMCENGEPPRLIAGSFESSSVNIDDTSFTVQLPFQICIYDTCSSTVHPTSNGIISLGDFATSSFSNGNIPAFGGQAVLHAFWDDLYIYAGQRHYMDYALCGSPGSRTVTFDWRMGRYAAPSSGPLYSFSATFYEDRPSRVYIKYYSTTDQGNSATIGMEGRANGQGTSYQFSVNQGVVTNGLGLIFDPRANYFGRAA